MRYLAATLVVAVAITGVAAAKQRPQKRNETHVACTVLGCQPVPAGCVQTYGRTFSGRPTGYDVIVCPR